MAGSGPHFRSPGGRDHNEPGRYGYALHRTSCASAVRLWTACHGTEYWDRRPRACPDGIVQQSQRGRERVATGRLRPHVQSSAICGAHTAGAGRARRAGQARGIDGCEGQPRGRADRAHRRSGAQSEQPRQPSAHCRCDVRRAVPRSRHDVRHDVEARASDEPAHGAQRAAAVLRSRFGLRRWTVRIAASIRTAGPRQAPRGIRRTLRRSSP